MLVDYSCSESSSDESGPKKDVRQVKKTKLPAPLLNGSKPSSIDDPDRHGGRIRSFAHERGNWASYCYFKLEESNLILDLRKKIQELCQDVDLKDVDELHLSLTKTFVLRHHWIDEFTKSIRESLAGVKSRNLYQISFNSIKIFENEDKTRTFIALGVNEADYSYLNRIVVKLDSCLGEFSLPSFYEDPDYHVSFLWCLGSHGEELRRIAVNLNDILEKVISEGTAPDGQDLLIDCDAMRCKIGNKLYQFPVVE